MRTRTMIGLLLVSAVVGLAARTWAAPTRKKVTCAEFRADVERSSKAVGMAMKLKPGDWGKTPAALRALPPKAELCGSTETTVFVTSPLFGKELEDYYRPIFEKVGCKPVKCEVSEKKSSCSCHGGGHFGRVGTEELNEAFGISWM